MRTFLISLLIIICSTRSFSQNYTRISGEVTDTSSRKMIPNATISVISARDSVLVGYGWTDAQGKFEIAKLPAGSFILLVSYPEYADYAQPFRLEGGADASLGTIKLVKAATLLNTVVIRGKVSAIKIRGDTTEFNAGSYVIQPNAKVEDLLKQLPGIQVDNNGRITVNGRAVRKVLVDGEEFFGDDPTLVTSNLRGDMIDKVQLFDKKSDQATFSGIDDGVREKTIDLKLKEDKKKGHKWRCG